MYIPSHSGTWATGHSTTLHDNLPFSNVITWQYSADTHKTFNCSSTRSYPKKVTYHRILIFTTEKSQDRMTTLKRTIDWGATKGKLMWRSTTKVDELSSVFGGWDDEKKNHLPSTWKVKRRRETVSWWGIVRWNVDVEEWKPIASSLRHAGSTLTRLPLLIFFYVYIYYSF